MSVEGELKSLDDLKGESFNSVFFGETIYIDGVCLPKNHLNYLEVIENFEIRDDDVWICSFAKAGTTWTQEMAWCIANDLDFEGAKVDLVERSPFFEIATIFESARHEETATEFVETHLLSSFEVCKNLPSPRIIKTHLHFHHLPRQLREGSTEAKIICVWRNPKDVCISYYHHLKVFTGYTGDLELLCELFLADKLRFCPFWDHVLGYWNQKNNSKSNILMVKYEDMKLDLSAIIKKTSQFLGKSQLSPNQLEILMDHLSFAKMKNNPAVNLDEWLSYLRKLNISTSDDKFIRKGEINQWKNEMSVEMSKRFDEWSADHLKGSDLPL